AGWRDLARPVGARFGRRPRRSSERDPVALRSAPRETRIGSSTPASGGPRGTGRGSAMRVRARRHGGSPGPGKAGRAWAGRRGPSWGGRASSFGPLPRAGRPTSRELPTRAASYVSGSLDCAQVVFGGAATKLLTPA